jgi:alpha-L-glutamate ligase-like protein
MIFKTTHLLRDTGVLGMNRRNAEYIMKYNPRSAFPLVDDKLLTKQLAERYQVPTPSLYHVIKHHGDIARFEVALKDHREFVVKPARGAGGSGIILIVDRIKKEFIKQSSEGISREKLSYHMNDILSGIYSLGGLEDQAIIEALIHPDPIFSAVAYKGVPDIRIIVYRGIPVMAMVRLPTKASDGKANLHRGALGVGINIARGTTLSGVHRSGVVTYHPDTGNSVKGIKIPYWESMLLVAAKAVDMTGLGYLGVDLVIDQQKGPLLLELNARPGLQIQMANRTGLRSRLELIDRASSGIFVTPETRVAWAMEKFPASDS